MIGAPDWFGVRKSIAAPEGVGIEGDARAGRSTAAMKVASRNSWAEAECLLQRECTRRPRAAAARCEVSGRKGRNYDAPKIVDGKIVIHDPLGDFVVGTSADAMRLVKELMIVALAIPNEHGCIVDDDVCIAHSRPLVTKKRCVEGKRPPRTAKRKGTR